MISAIIPVHNEAENIPLLVPRLLRALEETGRPYEIVFVDDGSNDGTGDALIAAAAKSSAIKVVQLLRNYGQTAAMMAAIDHARGDIIVALDGDLQNDPDDIGVLLAKLDEGYDVVSGWRRDRKDDAIRRNLPSRIANAIISRVSGVALHDYGCTLKAYRRDVIKGVRLYGEMHRFIPIYASWEGGTIAEVVVNHNPRIHGQSKYGLERVVKVVLDLMVVKFMHKYFAKPIHVFGGFGIASILLSFLVGGWALGLKIFEGRSLILTPLPLMAVMTFITGVMSILMGLLAEILVRTYYESQGKSVYVVKSFSSFAQERKAEDDKHLSVAES